MIAWNFLKIVLINPDNYFCKIYFQIFLIIFLKSIKKSHKFQTKLPNNLVAVGSKFCMIFLFFDNFIKIYRMSVPHNFVKKSSNFFRISARVFQILLKFFENCRTNFFKILQIFFNIYLFKILSYMWFRKIFMKIMLIAEICSNLRKMYSKLVYNVPVIFQKAVFTIVIFLLKFLMNFLKIFLRFPSNFLRNFSQYAKGYAELLRLHTIQACNVSNWKNKKNSIFCGSLSFKQVHNDCCIWDRSRDSLVL